MNIKEFYEITGSNYDEALSRLRMDKLLLKFTIKFADDPSYGSLKEAMAAGNWHEVFVAAHTLKGVSKNMSYTRLIDVVSELTEMVRHSEEQSVDEAAVRQQFELVQHAYEQIVENISKLQ